MCPTTTYTYVEWLLFLWSLVPRPGHLWLEVLHYFDSHKAIAYFNFLNLCSVGPVGVPIELLLIYLNLPQPPAQCGDDPVCVPIELLLTRAIVNLLQLHQTSVMLILCVYP